MGRTAHFGSGFPFFQYKNAVPKDGEEPYLSCRMMDDGSRMVRRNPGEVSICMAP